MKLLLVLLLAAAPMLPLVKTGDVQRIGKTVRLPGLIVHDADPPYIEIPAKVARTNEILEFIAVEPEGRDYESLLTVECKPSALQFALLLIGCETGTLANANSRVQIEVEHNNKRVPVDQWLIDRKTKKPPSGLRWVFNGSYFVKHPVTGEPVFLSDAEQAHIVLWWQPSIVINLADDRGNPYRGDDQGFEANPAAVPPSGTPVKLILRKLKH
ncbi:MAG: YdjY domain-containing protein [Verrucomicrobiae bacterium]|nr:YdjY domain-containing protein [Verrucomicrobiae bacterium]